MLYRVLVLCSHVCKGSLQVLEVLGCYNYNNNNNIYVALYPNRTQALQLPLQYQIHLTRDINEMLGLTGKY